MEEQKDNIGPREITHIGFFLVSNQIELERIGYGWVLKHYPIEELINKYWEVSELSPIDVDNSVQLKDMTATCVTMIHNVLHEANLPCKTCEKFPFVAVVTMKDYLKYLT